jgi:hypothetical protein
MAWLVAILRFPWVRWAYVPKHPRTLWRDWLWSYHRLANAGLVCAGPLILQWPMPWVREVRDLVGYGYQQRSGIRAALGVPPREGT